MKKRTGILIAAVFAFTACGTSLYTTSSGQRFNDGIYPVSPEEKQYAAASVTASDTETENMIKKTKESEIYLFSQDENQQTKMDNLSWVNVLKLGYLLMCLIRSTDLK